MKIKKEDFLIARVSKNSKCELKKRAKAQKMKLSEYIRDVIDRHLQNTDDNGEYK